MDGLLKRHEGKVAEGWANDSTVRSTFGKSGAPPVCVKAGSIRAKRLQLKPTSNLKPLPPVGSYIQGPGTRRFVFYDPAFYDLFVNLTKPPARANTGGPPPWFTSLMIIQGEAQSNTINFTLAR